MARPQRASDEPSRRVPAHPDLLRESPNPVGLPRRHVIQETERAPRIELRVVEIPGERYSFGLYDAISDSSIPRIERNKPFELSVEGRIWEAVDRVTLSSFRALTGPPWKTLPAELASRWDSRWAEIEPPKGDEIIEGKLPTSYPLEGHRLIVFDATFTDPWDEGRNDSQGVEVYGRARIGNTGVPEQATSMSVLSRYSSLCNHM